MGIKIKPANSMKSHLLIATARHFEQDQGKAWEMKVIKDS